MGCILSSLSSKCIYCSMTAFPHAYATAQAWGKAAVREGC